MSDIAGPPAPKEVQPAVRGTDKASYVAKDPNNEEARSRDTPQERAPKDQQEHVKTRDPAVSIAATAAHLEAGQEISGKVDRIDAEGRPIIVTDTVTIALKPDAGLKPTDDVHLEVTSADKRVTADLLEHNARTIDPPTRLTVTVIEVHQPAIPAKPSDTAPLADQPYQAPRSGPIGNQTTVISAPSSEDVALIIGGNPRDTKATQPAATGTESAGSEQGPAGTSRASSADLATLIQQQAAKASLDGPPAQPSGAVATSTISGLFAPAEGPGISPPIPGVDLAGTASLLQLLDPAISRVSPTEIATVLTVNPLTAAQARSLPVGATTLSTLAGDNGELVRVETSRGDFVLPAQPAANLAGELVRIAVDQPSGIASQNSRPAEEMRLPGQFVAESTNAASAKVSATFTAAAAPAPAVQARRTEDLPMTATVTAVQTSGAFLSASGPRTDLKIHTDAGLLTVTAPSSFRPEVGTLVLIEPGQEQRTQHATAATEHAALQTASAGVGAPETGATIAQSASMAQHVPNMLASWPAMEESISVLASAGTLVAGTDGLAAKTAQGGAKLTNSLLFFLAAAGRGPTAWLGQGAERALAAENPSLLKTLQSDIRRMASLPGETVGDWRPIVLPFDARGGEVPLAALLLQQKTELDPDADNEDDNEKDDVDDKGQRFILQVQFSVLGDIQLDGNIRRTQFDLTVRTAGEFSAPLKQDVQHLFQNALAANGYSGALDFDENTAFEVDAASMLESHLSQPGTPAI